MCVCVCVRMAWWESRGYKSLCLPSVDSEGEDADEVEEEEDLNSVNSSDSDDTAIHYILGDVTHPQAGSENVIIVHCVGTCRRHHRNHDESSVEFKRPGIHM